MKTVEDVVGPTILDSSVGRWDVLFATRSASYFALRDGDLLCFGCALLSPKDILRHGQPPRRFATGIDAEKAIADYEVGERATREEFEAEVARELGEDSD